MVSLIVDPRGEDRSKEVFGFIDDPFLHKKILVQSLYRKFLSDLKKACKTLFSKLYTPSNLYNN